MRIVKKNRNLVIPILFCCLFSCKKDVDDQAPKISFSTPLENQSFNVNEYVTVNATVSDNVQLTSVSVGLQDINHVPVHVTTAVPVSSPSMNLYFQYILDNIHLESGYYFMVVNASDGEHDTHGYRKIYISAIPRALKQVYLVSATGSAQTDLSTIDSAFTTISPYHTYSGDYLGSSVSSYHQQAYVCGNYTGAFTGTILQYNSSQFSFSPIVSSAPYYTGYYSDDQNEFVARYDGFIKGYNHLGSVIWTGTALSGYYGQQICFNDDRILTEQKDKVTGTKKLVTYFNTGSMEQSCNLFQDVVQFCEKDAANVFVFGNSSGQGIIQLYDRTANNLWSPYPFPLATGTILSVVQITPDTYLIGHSNGTIYLYQYSLNSVTTFMTGYTAIKLKFDEINDVLYVVEANAVNKFSYPLLTPSGTVTSSAPVKDVHLLYNR